eukprot:gene13300-14673_t
MKEELRFADTFLKDCQFRIKLRTTSNGEKLVIKSIVDEHNHENTQEAFSHLPKQRQLDQDLISEAEKLLMLKSNKKLVQNYIKTVTGKNVLLRDLHNLAAKNKPLRKNDFAELIAEMKKHQGAAVDVTVDDTGTVQAIYFQTKEMKSTFAAYPELVLVDATYKLNDLGMTLYLLMVVDGNGESEIGPPSKKKRGVGKKDYIKTAGKQNAFNSRQIRQLGVTMDNWWKRTNTPAIALSLATDKDGNLTVDYIDMDPNLVHKLLFGDVLSYDVHEKAKLIGCIIKRKGEGDIKETEASEQKRMTEGRYVKRNNVEGEKTKGRKRNAGTAVQSTWRNDRLCKLKHAIMECNWNDANDANILKLDMLEEDPKLLEMLVPFLPRSIGFVKYSLDLHSFDAFYWLRHQLPADISMDALVVKEDGNGLFKAASLIIFGTENLWPTLRILCVKYGIEKFKYVLQQDVTRDHFSCGCNITHADVSVAHNFSTHSQIRRLLDSYSTDIKRHVTGILRGTLLSKRMEEAISNSETDLILNRTPENWIFGERPDKSWLIADFIARIASADKHFSKILIERRGFVVRYALLPERLVDIPLFVARRLLDSSKRYNV